MNGIGDVFQILFYNFAIADIEYAEKPYPSISIKRCVATMGRSTASDGYQQFSQCRRLNRGSIQLSVQRFVPSIVERRIQSIFNIAPLDRK